MDVFDSPISFLFVTCLRKGENNLLDDDHYWDLFYLNRKLFRNDDLVHYYYFLVAILRMQLSDLGASPQC